MRDPVSVLNNVLCVYAEFGHYYDEGEVLIPDLEFSPQVKKFSTQFMRPCFKFEFMEPLPHVEVARTFLYSCVLFDGNASFYLEIEQGGELAIEKVTSFQTAISKATGVSSGSAHSISRLLLPDATRGFSINGLLDAEIGESEPNGENLVKISGKGPMNDDWKLSIDMSTSFFMERASRQLNRTLWTVEKRRKIAIEKKFELPNFSLNHVKKMAMKKVASWDDFHSLV